MDFPGIKFYSSSSLACSHCCCGFLLIILKLNIMKSKSYKNSREEKNNLWDAFIDYLENTYFPGASEVLDKQTIAFEYEAFKNCYA